MIAAAPAIDELYTSATPALLAALPRALKAPPLELLGWTATWYLRPYLTAAEHSAALLAALARARTEAAVWLRTPGELTRHDAARPLWHIAGAEPAKLWHRAVAGGTAEHMLLAQHACEIAELLPAPLRPAALRLGMLLPISSSHAATALSGRPHPRSDLVELLSRALLGHLIGRRAFVERLLIVHAGNRGVQLSDGSEAPRELAARLAGDVPGCDRSPKRLRAVGAHELARRAVASGTAWATLAVEAGLAEAEQLANGQRLLLLAALDRALGKHK